MVMNIIIIIIIIVYSEEGSYMTGSVRISLSAG